MSFWKDQSVLVTGGHGFLGKWVCKKLLEAGVSEEQMFVPSFHELDLRVWEDCVTAVNEMDVVIHLAGKDGGLEYNVKHSGSVFYENAVMNLQLMEAARVSGVKKMVSAGSVCAYPDKAIIPLREGEFWDGYPNPANAPYCIAKKLGALQAMVYHQEYNFHAVHLLLTNMYGPGDVFDPLRSRVVASLIRKFVHAKKDALPEVTMWGTGNASREFLYVEDAARAFIMATEKYDSPDPVNIGSGEETTIRTIVDMIAEIVDYKGEVLWDVTKPEGSLRRCSDVSLAEREFGFRGEVMLFEGLERTVKWYIDEK